MLGKKGNNFTEMLADMGQMRARYLEVSNYVTNSQLGGANLEYDK